VVWFGEALPGDAMAAARDAVGRCDLFFSIGTSGTVQPAASFADQARSNGARVVVVNPDVSGFASRAQVLLQGPSGRILPALVEKAWPETGSRQGG
jgi:NAD-dependent deacetylase